MRRRSSIITLDPVGSISPPNWQPTSIVDSRKLSAKQSNPSSNSPKNTIETTNFSYQAPQLMRYSTVFIFIHVENNFCIYNLCFSCITF